jgi:hypothetical protein
MMMLAVPFLFLFSLLIESHGPRVPSRKTEIFLIMSFVYYILSYLSYFFNLLLSPCATDRMTVVILPRTRVSIALTRIFKILMGSHLGDCGSDSQNDPGTVKLRRIVLTGFLEMAWSAEVYMLFRICLMKTKTPILPSGSVSF